MGEQSRQEIASVVERLVDEYAAADYVEDWDLDGLFVALEDIYPVSVDAADVTGSNLGREELAERLSGDAVELYDRREEELGEELMRALERYLLLQIIDQRWREHLYDMDYLREGIHLRGFAQIDPLVAYKNEAFTLFSDLMNTIWSDFSRMIFHVEVQVEGENGDAPEQQYTPSGSSTRAGRVSYSGGAGRASPARWPRPPARAGEARRRARAPPVQQRRVAEVEQIGRNDPCWCGSGKKFKKLPRRRSARRVAHGHMTIARPTEVWPRAPAEAIGHARLGDVARAGGEVQPVDDAVGRAMVGAREPAAVEGEAHRDDAHAAPAPADESAVHESPAGRDAGVVGGHRDAARAPDPRASRSGCPAAASPAAWRSPASRRSPRATPSSRCRPRWAPSVRNRAGPRPAGAGRRPAARSRAARCGGRAGTGGAGRRGPGGSRPRAGARRRPARRRRRRPRPGCRPARSSSPARRSCPATAGVRSGGRRSARASGPGRRGSSRASSPRSRSAPWR